MKIYIVGTVGSGKSTLARKLSEKNSMRVFHLDNIVHEGERNRTDKEVFESIECIFKNECFIIEDTLRERFNPLLDKVDKIIYLDLPKNLLKYRIIKRYVKQKLRLEKSTQFFPVEPAKGNLISVHILNEPRFPHFVTAQCLPLTVMLRDISHHRMRV